MHGDIQTIFSNQTAWIVEPLRYPRNDLNIYWEYIKKDLGNSEMMADGLNEAGKYFECSSKNKD